MKLYFHLLDFQFDVLAAEDEVVMGIPVEPGEKASPDLLVAIFRHGFCQLFGTVHPSSSKLAAISWF